jgi:hypothetical protein
MLLYVEDLKRGTNKDIGPKDIFMMGSYNFGAALMLHRVTPARGKLCRVCLIRRCICLIPMDKAFAKSYLLQLTANVLYYKLNPSQKGGSGFRARRKLIQKRSIHGSM